MAKVNCGLSACTPGSAPGSTLGNEYGRTLPLPFSLFRMAHYEHDNDCLPRFNLYRYDTGRDKFIDFEELKHMMEKLGVPQTHLCLKEMIKEVDEDFDGKISFREVWTNYADTLLCILMGMYLTVI